MGDADPRIVVVGLGYVGLPLAVALARDFVTIGFDIDATRIAELNDGFDRTREIDAERLRASSLVLTAEPDTALTFAKLVPASVGAETVEALK